MKQFFGDQHQQADDAGFTKSILDEIRHFSKQKRIWKKAYEILETIVISTQDIQTSKENNIFTYQFLINFLTVKNDQKLKFI